MMQTVLGAGGLFVIATLLGGMTLYSAGLAPLLFTQLPMKDAARLLRVAFPWFYLFIIVLSALGALLMLGIDTGASALLGIVFLSGLVARQLLMPAINRASDAGAAGKARFRRLHGTSVAINFVQLALVAVALYGFV